MKSTSQKAVPLSLPSLVWSMVLPGLACLIGVYVLLHSPAQGTIAVLLRSPSHGCYFCVASYPWSQFGGPDPATSQLCLASR